MQVGEPGCVSFRACAEDGHDFIGLPDTVRQCVGHEPVIDKEQNTC